MTRLIVILTIFLVACSEPAKKVSNPEREKINGDCDRVVQLLSQGDEQEGMDRLKSISVITPDTLDSLAATMTRQMESLLPGYGKLTGYEFAKESVINDIIARRSYIFKFQRAYLRCSLTIYKTDTGWKVTNIDYNDNITEVFN